MSDLQTLEFPRSAPPTQKRKGTTPDRQSRSKDWTIKGLPEETVEIARDAARESGMKINAWVSRVFEEAAAEPPPKRVSEFGQLGTHSLNLSDEVRFLRSRNEELLQTITNLSEAIKKMAR